MVTREHLGEIKLFIIFLFCILFNVIPCLAILCGDEQCKEVIALARTVNTYASRGDGTLSFKANKKVSVYGKSAGKNKDLFLVEIDGKLGYAPHNLIQEQSTLKRDLVEVPSFKLVAESAQNKEPSKEEKMPENLPSKSQIFDSAATISSSTSSDSYHSSVGDKTESYSSNSPHHGLKTDTISLEGQNDGLMKDSSGENENFTVDDLNQYSVDHVNNEMEIEHQTSEKLTEQGQHIHLDHQEINLHSSTKIQRNEPRASPASSPPDHVNFQSADDKHKSDNILGGTDQVIAGSSSIDQSLQLMSEHCKSSIVFEGTTICEEYYDSTVPSESAVIDKQSSHSVFVYTSPQLHPSTESTESYATPVNSPDLPSTDTVIIGSDAPSFVSSVVSQSVLGSSLEHLEKEAGTMQSSHSDEASKMFATQSTPQQSESVTFSAANFEESDSIGKKTEASSENPSPTDEPSTFSKLTNYVKTVLTSIGGEETETKNSEVEENVNEEEEMEQEDEEEDENEDEEDEEEEDGEINDSKLPVSFSEKETSTNGDTVDDQLPSPHVNIAEDANDENDVAPKTDSVTSDIVQNFEKSSNNNFIDLDSEIKMEKNEEDANSATLVGTKVLTDSSDSSLKEPMFVTNSDPKKVLDSVIAEKNSDQNSSNGSSITVSEGGKSEEKADFSTKKILTEKNKIINANIATNEKASESTTNSKLDSLSKNNAAELDRSRPNTEKVHKQNEKDAEEPIKENTVPSAFASISDEVKDNERNNDALYDTHQDVDKNDEHGKNGIENHDSQTSVNENTISEELYSNPDEGLNISISETSHLSDNHAEMDTATSSLQTQSISTESIKKDESVNEVNENQHQVTSSETYDSSLPVLETSESKVVFEKSLTSVETTSSNVQQETIPAISDSSTLKSDKDPDETIILSVSSKYDKDSMDGTKKLQEKDGAHNVEEKISDNSQLVDTAVHEIESSKNENGLNQTLKDTLEIPKATEPQGNSEFLSGDPDSNDKVYEKPTNSEINADTSESHIDVLTDTKSTLLDGDAIPLPFSDKEIDDELTTTTYTESTRSILSFEDENSDADYIDDHLIETSEGISGILREYIGLLPVYLQIIIDMLPLQIQNQLYEWEKNGLSPRVTVVTWITAAFTSIVCIFTLFIQRRSKEQMLIGKLGAIEQKMFTVSTERDVLQEELNTVKHQAAMIHKNLLEQQSLSIPLQQELDEIRNENKELQNHVETATYQVEMLQTKLVSLQKLADTTDEMNKDFIGKLGENEKILFEMEQNLQKVQAELTEEKELNEKLKLSKEQLVAQVYQLENTCSQLLQEAQVWNERVSELTKLLETEKKECEELKDTMKLKETEIKGLQNTIEEIKVIEKSMDQSEEEGNENLKNLLDASLVREQLKEVTEEKSLLQEQLKVVNQIKEGKEGELSKAKNEIEKLKHSYNQALQVKMEAQTKLDVLTNYFKEKEVQLQKELGAQEAMRQQKEEDASSASSHIALVEQENISYKHQLATLKQELEETERGYKNQVAMHEKKAHENWLAARGSERKLEDAKQESSQLRQRLTLLEREQANWSKAEVDGVIRPVPKRYLSPNGEVPYASNQSISQQNSVELPNSSSQALPLSHSIPEPGKIANPPLLPFDRPVPPPALHPLDPRFPLPPPPFLPPRPFGERLPPPPHLMDPWRFPPPPMPPMHRRMSPQDYDRGHLPTPPHSMSPQYDRELDRHSINSRETFDRRPPMDRFSPPLRDTSSRDSRNSSPPHMLPHFHDNPPLRPYGFPLPPPAMLPPRFTPPPPPLHRREPYFSPNMPLDQRAVDRSKDKATNASRNSHERTPPSETKTTATAV